VRNNDLENHVSRFLEAYVPEDSPFIIGFSGGVDSSALLHLIHKACCGTKRRCHVVHVDHGWREESAEEAKMLEQRVEALGIPFFCYRLPPCPKGENIEDWSRDQRMGCLKNASSVIGTDIVFLAHQADDQLEVVLKRFLEGASLLKFRGIRSIEKRQSLTIMRPLLSIRRSVLLSYLHAHSLPYLNDPTNKDTTFLRARMREVVFPFLRDTFGKEFDNSILRVCHEAADLEQYIADERERRFILHETPDAIFATVRDADLPSPFLVRSIIDHLRGLADLPSFSRSQVEAAADAFCGSSKGARSFYIGEGGMLAERRFLAVFRKKPEPVEPTYVVEREGVCTIGGWNIRWKPARASTSELHDTKGLFSGAVTTVYIPQQPFTICPTSDRLLRTIRTCVGRSSLAVSLRPYVPAIVQAFRLVADPLTGYTISLPTGTPCCAVTVQRSGRG